MITFNNFSVKLKLYNSDKVLVPETPVKIQFYSSETKEWVTLYSVNTINGIIDLRKTVSGSPEPEATFYAMVMYDKMPPIRIIPTKTISGVAKQMVIANSFSFRLLSAQNTFEVDFGTLYGIPTTMISDQLSAFLDILPVATHYPISMTTTEPEPEPETVPVPINELYTNIVSEIASASQLAANSPFKLSNISLKLKAVIHKDGETMSASLLDMANSENINGNAISELFFDITPTQNETVTTAKMPDLTGLTETAVRKILKSLNLRLNPVYQQNEDVVNGDSFKQSPAKNEQLPDNQLVTVIFSKNEH